MQGRIENGEAKNLLRLVDNTNRLSQFAVESVLSCNTPEERADVIMNILEVIECLADLNNYGTIMALWGAITSSAIHRLKTTRTYISENFEDLFSMLNELLSPKHRFKALREAMESIEHPPLIPYSGMFLSEIAHIESTVSQEVVDPNTKLKLVNVNRLRFLFDKIRQFQTYQHHSGQYTTRLSAVPSLIHSLERDVLSDQRILRTDDELYEWSKTLE